MSTDNRRPGRALITYGLGFGDECKGATVDWLCRVLAADLVVRYGGGPQAAHHVQLTDSRWHCFSQFGSGSLAGLPTALGPDMLIELEMLEREAEHLRQLGRERPLADLTVDSRCRLVTPMNKLVNQAQEIVRGGSAQGSCGQGVGDAFFDRQSSLSVSLADLASGQAAEKLAALERAKTTAAFKLLRQNQSDSRIHGQLIETIEYFQDRCRAERLLKTYLGIVERSGLRFGPGLTAQTMRQVLDNGGTVIMEGSQGALLDRLRGFSPHVTKPPILASGAYRLLAEAAAAGRPDGSPPAAGLAAPLITRVGILRAYLTRHGHGPFVTERPELAAIVQENIVQENCWQGLMRYGWLDLPALRYGLALNGGADWLALNCLDHLTTGAGFSNFPVCESYAYDGDPGLLEGDFLWERLSGGRCLIHGLRLDDQRRYPEWGRLTKVLSRCRPHGLRYFKAWPAQPSGHPRSADDLTSACRRFIDYLSGPDGLNCPVGMASFGPTAADRLQLIDL